MLLIATAMITGHDIVNCISLVALSSCNPSWFCCGGVMYYSIHTPVDTSGKASSNGLTASCAHWHCNQWHSMCMFEAILPAHQTLNVMWQEPLTCN